MQVIRRTPIAQQALSHDLHPVLDRVIRNRGISKLDELSTQGKHLQHYQSLWDIASAASLLADAIQQEESIIIVGDFDADGATSSALCILALREMGHKRADYIVPNRFDFGYGLTSPVVDIAHEKGAKVLVTVDNGISSIDGVAHAKAKGMTVIVTDHHLPGETLPIADAIVNPNQLSCDFSSKNLAGVGVAFYVMSATKNELEKRGYFTQKQITPPNMANFLDIVAVGTVADVVPLDKNNRILVHQGIQRIRSGKTRPGILALLNVSNRQHSRCCTSDIGFAIGPRLNAAGRLEDMSVGIECLLSDDHHKAAMFAAQLDGLNQSRREIEQSMRDDALRLLDELALDTDDLPSALSLYKSDFHQGVVGILAGRLKEKYYRPTVVFADEDEHTIKGSARSVEGIHIRDVLVRIDSLSPNLMNKFGGHAMAAGLSLAKANLDEFSDLWVKVVDEFSQSLSKEARVLSDGELQSSEISIETASALKFAYPWGQGFEAPVFDGEFELVNQKIVGQNHLKMTLKVDGLYVDAIAFSVDTEQWPNHAAKHISAVYKLDINEFRGQSSVQFIVDAIKVVDPVDSLE